MASVLILLDLGLPDLPGEEVLRRLRNQPRTADIPILVVTGKTEAYPPQKPRPPSMRSGKLPPSKP